MELNADFSRRAVVHAGALKWVASPSAGVDRRMLDRIGDEVARATSIVRYAPGSRFPAHVHGGGEEFLVLEGVFEEEHGAYPAGSYIRNPPTSSHTPGSGPGCTIFVKLWQFDLDDRHGVRLPPEAITLEALADRPRVEAALLHQDERETVCVERWSPGSTIRLGPSQGIEVLVLEGAMTESGEGFSPQSWLRLPAGAALHATAGARGARVWVKEGHLAQPPQPPAAA